VTQANVVVLLACLLGIPAGIGAFTFVYAHGFSYLSTDPRACVNCHVMNDHWVRSPLLNLNRACQPCHAVAEKELEARVLTIQDRHYALLERAAQATTDMLDAIVAAANSMGFHAPQELARILGEVIDHARQGQLEAERAARKR
jgi:formate-dependent nitrite reductase cytochrome c552 subunit